MYPTRHKGKFFALSVIASVVLMSGCGSTPKQSSVTPERAPTPVETSKAAAITPEHKLVEAKKVWADTGDKVQRDEFLLQAADLYLQNNQTTLAQQILFELQQEGVETSQVSKYTLLLVKAYLAQPNASVESLLALLDTINDNSDVAIEKAYLQTQLYTQQGHLAAAANSLMKTDLSSEEKVTKIWAWVTSLSRDTLNEINAQYPALSPFVTLRELTEEHIGSPNQLAQSLTQFQQVYRGHVLSEAIPQEVMEAVNVEPIYASEIAVLLPLSGRLARTGNAVKNGIMAAYYNDVEKENSERNLPRLRFIDTNESSPQSLIEQIGETKFVIGPLLKETVDSLIPILPPSINVLALNRPEENASTQPTATNAVEQLTQNQQSVLEIHADVQQEMLFPIALNYFGLAPEDEAIQLAEFIFSKGYRAPIVISAESGLYQRMDSTFKAHWIKLNNIENKQRANITSVSFNDSSSLREGVTQALDVAQSNARINQIEYMTNDEVYNMPRSRRDIDAIVAFASPQDTELLNPIIEASLNPYDGKLVPVYATSRSMDYDSGKNQWRDLQNVHFIDMPWLMPQHNWKQLEEDAEKAWSNQNTMQKRLFAFGYDAYQLLPELGMLNTLHYITHEGLTGKLSVNKRGEVIRQQPQAIIRDEEIQMVME